MPHPCPIRAERDSRLRSVLRVHSRRRAEAVPGNRQALRPFPQYVGATGLFNDVPQRFAANYLYNVPLGRRTFNHPDFSAPKCHHRKPQLRDHHRRRQLANR